MVHRRSLLLAIPGILFPLSAARAAKGNGNGNGGKAGSQGRSGNKGQASRDGKSRGKSQSSTSSTGTSSTGTSGTTQERTASSTATSEDDATRILEAVEQGHAKPLDKILAVVRARYSGKVVAIRLKGQPGDLRYDIRILSPDNRLIEVQVIARTARIVEERRS